MVLRPQPGLVLRFGRTDDGAVARPRLSSVRPHPKTHFAIGCGIFCPYPVVQAAGQYVLVSGMGERLNVVCLYTKPYPKQSAIERIARLQHPDLPPEGVVYTRRVTQIWCVFFSTKRQSGRIAGIG